MKKILLLTGPGGSGKTTIATMLCEQCGYAHVDGDHEDTEFFPSGQQWLPTNKHLLKKAHKKIIQRAKDLIESGKNVVIDYIIFGCYSEFIQECQKEFGDHFKLVVLFPHCDTLQTRDQNRSCWTTGRERIEAVYQEFQSIQTDIGAENFLDTTDQTPQETCAVIRKQYLL
jgi:chloramphenicol 3-O-phosphotransferase